MSFASKPTHADCDYAVTVVREEWRDRWGQAHEREVIRCALEGSPTCGDHYTASAPQPSACGWARILMRQTRDA
jgi:hypothetical protein